jgi:hypothetical protein
MTIMLVKDAQVIISLELLGPVVTPLCASMELVPEALEFAIHETLVLGFTPNGGGDRELGVLGSKLQRGAHFVTKSRSARAPPGFLHRVRDAL